VSGQTVYTYVVNDPINHTDPTGTEGLFGYTPAEAQGLAVTQQLNAAETMVANSYVVRQMELKITAALLGTVGLIAKSPLTLKLSVLAGAAALVDQKATTGHVDPREVALIGIGAVPGVGTVTSAVSGMKKVGEAAQLGQDFVHAGAAAAGAGLAVGEAMPGQRPNSTAKPPSSEQKPEKPSSPAKPDCIPERRC
jgi:hypothetical protein